MLSGKSSASRSTSSMAARRAKRAWNPFIPGRLGIAGTPLRDGYNFGQTLWDDFGRPYNTGYNNVSGFSARAERGRFFAYIRGEYQFSPAYAGLTASQQSSLEEMLGISSVPSSQATGTVDHFDLLDTYIGMRLGIFDIAAGKQSLWWGPGTMGGMLMSDNADPLPMVKVNQVEPIVLPSFLAKIRGPCGCRHSLAGSQATSTPVGLIFTERRSCSNPLPTGNLASPVLRRPSVRASLLPFTIYSPLLLKR